MNTSFIILGNVQLNPTNTEPLSLNPVRPRSAMTVIFLVI